jgi:pyridoxal phosphate enzyme (YggS family)
MPTDRMWFTISENVLEHSIATQKIGIVTRITEQLADLNARIGAAAALAERDAESVQILAVCKKHPLDSIRDARNAGLLDFGENYVQEALPKITALGGDFVWHFIGQIQSNKTRQIAEHFDWVHTLSRVNLAQRLSRQRPEGAGALQVCIQIRPLDVDGAELDNRGGIPAEQLPELANLVRDLPRLHLRGLMMMPLPGQIEEITRNEYARTRHAFDALNADGHELDTLSMGMSDDLETAIMEGSTMLRIGTALFGPRNDE